MQGLADAASLGVDGTPAAEGSGPQGDGEGRRRRRRGGRGRGEGRAEGSGELAAGNDLNGGDTQPPQDAGDSLPAGSEDATGEARAEGDEPSRDGGRRRGRGRDRFRREPREDGAGEGTGAASGSDLAAVADDRSAPAEAVSTSDAPAATTGEGLGRPDAEAAAPAAPAAAPKAPAAPAAAAPAQALPEPFVLPLADLQALANSAGLEWIGSDADKVRAAQDAIAAEPRPVHVPREPRPPVVIDEGPLVLVETRKDLSQMKLPFEAAANAGASEPQA